MKRRASGDKDFGSRRGRLSDAVSASSDSDAIGNREKLRRYDIGNMKYIGLYLDVKRGSCRAREVYTTQLR
jgi:hypothetical protein